MLFESLTVLQKMDQLESVNIYARIMVVLANNVKLCCYGTVHQDNVTVRITTVIYDNFCFPMI